MTETFKVGDVAIIAYSIHLDWPVGREVTILGPLEPLIAGRASHHIGWSGHRRVMAMPSSLRKKHLPPDWLALARKQTVDSTEYA